jgi:hypothetical protein
MRFPLPPINSCPTMNEFHPCVLCLYNIARDRVQVINRADRQRKKVVTVRQVVKDFGGMRRDGLKKYGTIRY